MAWSLGFRAWGAEGLQQVLPTLTLEWGPSDSRVGSLLVVVGQDPSFRGPSLAKNPMDWGGCASCLDLTAKWSSKAWRV